MLGLEFSLCKKGKKEERLVVNNEKHFVAVSQINDHIYHDYRLFDTAQVYETEGNLGAAIKERNIPREDVTIVTKLHPQYHGYESTISAVQGSLENLQTDYIDVFLIHTKHCDGGYFKCPEGKFAGMAAVA